MLERRRWWLPRAVDIQIRHQSDLVTRWDLPVRNRLTQTQTKSGSFQNLFQKHYEHGQSRINISSSKIPPLHTRKHKIIGDEYSKMIS